MAVQVRQQFERLPGAPRQFSRLAKLHTMTQEMTQKAADMEAKAVPRPDPPQYSALWQSVQRFLSGLANVARVTGLIARLKVCRSM